MAPPGVYHVDHPTPQLKLAMGHEGGSRRSWDDPEAFAAILMGEVLDGSGMVSRLRSRLRAEEGLVYRAGATFGLAIHGSGDFQVFIESEGATLGRAAELAVAEIERLRDEPVGDEELRLATKALLDAFPTGFDTAEKVAGRFAEDELLGRPHAFWASYRDRLQAVAPADVRRAARRHLHPDELRVVVVGRWGDLSDEDRARLAGLAGGEIVRLAPRDPVTMARPGTPGSDE